MRQADAAHPAQEETGPAARARRAASRGLAVLVAVSAAAALVAVAAAALRADERSTSAPPPLVDGGAATSFGAIAVRDVTRSRRHVMKHDGSGHAVERVWTTRLRVAIDVQNRLDRPVLFSLGQLRLSVHALGTTAAPLRAGRLPDALPAHSIARTWVTYLAPEGARRLSLEFSDVGTGRAIALALPAAPTVDHVHQEGSK